MSWLLCVVLLEHRGVCTFLNYSFVWVCSQEWDARSYSNSAFSFLRNLFTVLHSGYTKLHFHQQGWRIPFSPHPLQHFFFFLLYNIVLVLPYINMHPPRVYTCSPSWTPPPSSYHPSGSSQCTSPKLPVSCIEPGLVIRFLYDIIHVLMPFSQINQLFI